MDWGAIGFMWGFKYDTTNGDFYNILRGKSWLNFLRFVLQVGKNTSNPLQINHPQRLHLGLRGSKIRFKRDII